MKRLLLVFCACSTLAVLGFVVLRVATKKEPSASPAQLEQAKQIADAFSKVETRPLTLEQFSAAVEKVGATNLSSLSEDGKRKLLECISQFYACYSSGNFDAFKKFRMRASFTVGENLALAVKKSAPQLKSNEEILRFAWNEWNGPNKIGEASETSIALSLAKRQDLGLAIRQPAAGNFPGSTASCWEGALTYQPSPEDLLKKDGSLRLFTLEVFVRFSPHSNGPATPLRLMGYWDSTRADWMPLCLCTVLHVGEYDTIF
jgi:hypothetical protein